MGRRKLEIKRIEDKSSRQVTFSKRRNGLMKKARELSVLCDVDVALVVFSGPGKLYDFCAGNTSLAKILQRYQSCFEGEGKVSKGVDEENCCTNSARFGRSAELLQIVERELEEPNAERPSVTDLIQLEMDLNDALIQTRSRKNQLLMESVATLHEKERMLREENEVLANEITALNDNGINLNEAAMDLNNLAKHPDDRSPSQRSVLTFSLIE